MGFTPTHTITALLAAAYISQALGNPDAADSASTAICPRKQGLLSLGRQLCPLVLDDQSAAAPPWEPWTGRPHCVAENRKHGGRDKTLGDDGGVRADKMQQQATVRDGDNRIAKYCLYTNSFFGENGISVLARPEDAASAAGGILWNAYHRSSFPSAETVQYLGELDPPAYHVVDMPDKGGKGVVATRRIRRLETFMVDHAAITGDLRMWGSVTQRDGRPLLDRAAEQLIDPEVVFSLNRGAGGFGVEGVMRANTFRTYLGGVPQKTLFPKISRINHSCRPNAIPRFSEGGLTGGVAAFRDIEPGEEITISYIPLTDTSEERAAKLGAWGFSCSCALCTAPATQTAASDARREKLARGIDTMVEAIQRGDLRGAVSILRAALVDLEMEGLEAISGDVHEGLARIFWAVGDKKTAREHGRKAVDYRADYGLGLEPRNRTADLESMLASFDQ